MRKHESVFALRFVILDLPRPLSWRAAIESISAFCFLFSAFLGSGCVPKEPPAAKGYFGPTKSLDQVVAGINANNQRIPSLWARFSFEALLRDPETNKDHFLAEELGNTIQYRAPAEFRLRANKTAAGLILDLGINRERFWLIAPKPGPDTMWWGMVSPGNQEISKKIPIPPQGMLEVLGISTLNTDLRAQPAPVLRFNNDARIYMLVWVRQYGDRFIATREACYDMETLLPVKVLLFDANGRIVLRADLSAHKPIAPDLASSPKVATKYHLFFPETRSWMQLDLTAIAFTQKDAPNDNSFRFAPIPVAKEIRVDEEK